MKKLQSGSHPEDVKRFTTQELRDRFLIEDLMQEGAINATYTMHDRMVVIGAVPTTKPLMLSAYEEWTKSEYFLARRELGIINLGQGGKVTVDGEVFELAHLDCLYVGKGKKEISFESADAKSPAMYYVNSCPAHATYPTKKAVLDDANKVNLGSNENANERTIYQYIHETGIESCQLVMGFTRLHPGSIWNTFPPHTHFRRMEVYFYFDVPEDQLVMHFMGEPTETRHLAMHNNQGVISPEWSIHSGAGTSNYSFVWSMAGENKAFTDMDGQSVSSIR
jgi:4-deoxy-L-threo-5-hexosulose-uronate ketol-isomerase